MPRTSSKMSQVWQRILAEPEVQRELGEKGFFEVTSRELNDYSKPMSGPDARILVKFDSSHQLPEALRESGLAPITVNRARFAVGAFDIYSELPPLEDADLRVVRYKSPHDAMNVAEVTSESLALLVASASRVIDEFAGADVKLSFFGKVVMKTLDFSVSKHGGEAARFVGSGMQIELDAVFENDQQMLLVEAKIGRPRDFNIRQLYFPYRHFREKTEKVIRPILMVYSRGVFEFIEYRFADPQNMSSFEIVRTQVVAVLAPDSPLENLRTIAKNPETVFGAEGVTFPQANDFDKIIEVSRIASAKPVGSEEIGQALGVVGRQVDYYIQAARYIGLVESSATGVVATKLAQGILGKSLPARNFDLAALIVQIPTVGQCFLFTTEEGFLPTVEYASMNLATPEDFVGVNDTTRRRRISTAISWTRWIISNMPGKDKVSMS